MIRVHLLVSASLNSPHKAAQTGFADTIRTLHHSENIATVMSIFMLFCGFLKIGGEG